VLTSVDGDLMEVRSTIADDEKISTELFHMPVYAR